MRLFAGIYKKPHSGLQSAPTPPIFPHHFHHKLLQTMLALETMLVRTLDGVGELLKSKALP